MNAEDVESEGAVEKNIVTSILVPRQRHSVECVSNKKYSPKTVGSKWHWILRVYLASGSHGQAAQMDDHCGCGLRNSS
jgi:hypothetical protein